ncbi:MAG: hypothetical protein V7605_2581 [Acidimicrobiaceae bacterium]
MGELGFGPRPASVTGTVAVSGPRLGSVPITRVRSGLPVVALALWLVVIGTGSAAPWPAAAASSHRAQVKADVPVTPMDQGIGPASNSPALAVDPHDSHFVVLANRLDAPDFGCSLQVSGNRGRGWVTANPVPTLPPGAEKCYGPEIAFDRDGVLYYLFVGLAGPGNRPMGVFLTTSGDQARTFSAPRQLLGPLNFGVRMAIDPTLGANGRIHLVWLHAVADVGLGSFGAPPNPIMAAHSDDGGQTFTDPVQVSDPVRERVVAPALALGPDHGVEVGYYDLGSDAVDYQGLEGPVWDRPWSVVVSSSTDGGTRFGPGSVVDEGVMAPGRVMLIFTMPPPALAAGPGHRVCAAWADARQGDADVLLRCSSDQGRSWAGLQRVNDDPPGNGLSQYLPAMTTTSDGRIDIIFYDRRNDPDNIGTEVFFTWSTDGGRHFAPNRQVSSESFDSRIGQQYEGPAAQGQVEFGTRLGLLSGASRALMAWPDTRNSRPATTGQDLFATEADFPASTAHRLVTPVVGAALGTLALAAWAYRRRRRRRARTVEP